MMGRPSRTIVIVVLALCAGCLSRRPPAPIGARGSTLVAVNVGAWYGTFGGDAGVGEQILAGRAVAEHVYVGGRLTGLAELKIDLFGDEEDDEAGHVVDFGPFVGVGASWSRLSLVLGAGPMLTHVKQREAGAWRSAWTIGLGLDAGIAVRLGTRVGVGLHALENFNREESATGILMRVQGSVY
jgi:hypothetical protein